MADAHRGNGCWKKKGRTRLAEEKKENVEKANGEAIPQLPKTNGPKFKAPPQTPDKDRDTEMKDKREEKQSLRSDESRARRNLFRR